MQKSALMTCVLSLVVLSTTASFATNPDPAVNREQLTSLVASVYDAPAHKFVLKQIDGPNNRGFRVVFVHNGNRYTFDHDWWVGGIQIWIRPDGTSHPDVPADAFSDDNMDGIVDFGTDGHMRIFAVADHYGSHSEGEGSEHQPYWQKIYNEALVGLQATLSH